MQDIVGICTYCSNQQTKGRVEGMKMFKSYVDGIICTVRVEPDNNKKNRKFITQQPAIYLRKSEHEG